MSKRKYNLVEVAKLATAFKRSTQTILRWVKNNDARLTSDTAKQALK